MYAKEHVIKQADKKKIVKVASKTLKCASTYTIYVYGQWTICMDSSTINI